MEGRERKEDCREEWRERGRGRESREADERGERNVIKSARTTTGLTESAMCVARDIVYLQPVISELLKCNLMGAHTRLHCAHFCAHCHREC